MKNKLVSQAMFLCLLLHVMADAAEKQPQQKQSRNLKNYAIAGLMILIPAYLLTQNSFFSEAVQEPTAELSHELISDCCHELYPRPLFYDCDRTYEHRTLWKHWRTQLDQLRTTEERLNRQSPYPHPEDLANVRYEISTLKNLGASTIKAACPRNVRHECGSFFERRDLHEKHRSNQEYRYPIPNRNRTR